MGLSTGVRFLDEKFDDGVPEGSLVAFTAPPDSQAEVLLWSLVREHDTHFVSTIRPGSEVTGIIEGDGDGGDDRSDDGTDEGDDGWESTWEPLGSGGLRTTRVDAGELLDDPGIAEVPGSRSNLVVDGISGLETAPRDEYLAFLNDVKSRLRETDSIGVLFGVDSSDPPPHRTLTLHRADVTWRLHQSLGDRRVDTTLVVAKLRNGRPVLEPIDLDLTDEVDIDLSKNIS